MRWPVQTIAVRFWSKVNRGGPEDCWLWMGAIQKRQGYGVFGISGKGMIRVHRVSWVLSRGPIPDGLQVLHRCDVRPCVNPAHLFLGTQQDNMDDMRAKGRQARFNDGSRRGEKNARAKVTREQVDWMRSHYVPRSPEYSSVALARRFGLSPRYAIRILRGCTWKEEAA